MAFRVALRNKAKRELDRLDPGIRKRLWAAIDALKEDPMTPRPGVDIKLLESRFGLRRVRVGDYRMFYFVDRDQGFVFVTEVLRRRSGTCD